MVSIEPQPSVAAAVFGERVDLARRFADNLGRDGEERGLIGPLEAPRLWTRHILNCAVAAPVFSGRVGDVGSGAGLPGIVLAIARPDIEWVLIEPMERRVAWLDEQVSDLALENVEVVRTRGEDWSGRGTLDMVTARAVSAVRTLLPSTAPLVKDGGEIAFLKGANVAAELTAAAKVLTRYRVSDVRVETFGDGVVTEPTRVMRGRVRA